MSDESKGAMSEGDVAIAAGVVLGLIVEQLAQKKLIDRESLRRSVAEQLEAMGRREQLATTVDALKLISEIMDVQQ